MRLVINIQKGRVNLLCVINDCGDVRVNVVIPFTDLREISVELFILDIELGRIDYGRHTFREEKSCQCNDKRLDIEVRNKESLYDTKRKTDTESQADGSS